MKEKDINSLKHTKKWGYCICTEISQQAIYKEIKTDIGKILGCKTK